MPSNTIHGDKYKGIDRNLILLSCDEKRLKKANCHTDQCNSNTDCYSNNCVNGACMTDPENPAYLCKTVNENNELKVKCLLNYQEQCNNDNECADNAICNIDKICQIERTPETKEENKSNNSIIIIIVVAVIIIILIVLLLFWRRRRSIN
ncbi:hypothetical protein PIROE2DRAFT_63561 [Piromyces sp. E2]|nr:hypothetical protein PIROE2DRAFT_63561 [Piromyces sp. E2]|eukprot:OUM59782.1 hypothetical protein PIROE2DRAFT_63561 [Piromyces sp. E2]